MSQIDDDKISILKDLIEQLQNALKEAITKNMEKLEYELTFQDPEPREQPTDEEVFDLTRTFESAHYKESYKKFEADQAREHGMTLTLFTHAVFRNSFVKPGHSDLGAEGSDELKITAEFRCGDKIVSED